MHLLYKLLNCPQLALEPHKCWKSWLKRLSFSWYCSASQISFLFKFFYSLLIWCFHLLWMHIHHVSWFIFLSAWLHLLTAFHSFALSILRWLFLVCILFSVLLRLPFPLFMLFHCLPRVLLKSCFCFLWYLIVAFVCMFDSRHLKSVLHRRLIMVVLLFNFWVFALFWTDSLSFLFLIPSPFTWKLVVSVISFFFSVLANQFSTFKVSRTHLRHTLFPIAPN